jgi:hypothetical protein
MAKPSKKQRGKLKATSVKPADAKKKHIKFNSEGDVAVSKAVLKKKRARTNESAQKEGKGKSDRSPENIQQAKYYLEKWKTRNEPIAEGELPWKFKVLST